MGIPRLATYGIEPKHVDILCDNAKRASSMKANPVVLSQVQLRETLLAAI